ncbi:hypothetical protein N7540_003274 [Penicillium herquei]|nr:hypothetical protein N7540_003274 [Penicillium herquei]
MMARERNILAPVAKTCVWLEENKDYRAWHKRESLAEHYGLLFIKGKPGSGKSTIMKALLNHTLSERPMNERLVAAFFFDAGGTEMARSPLGFYRSIVYQLTKLNHNLRKLFLQQRHHFTFGAQADDEQWTEAELQSFLRSVYESPSAPYTTIFVDALDECDLFSARDLAYFLRDLTISANEKGAALNICLSSRLFPSITLSRCPEIFMDRSNRLDIATYVGNRFSISRAPKNNWNWSKLRNEIVKRSSGVFLWVVLIVDVVLREWEEGKSIKALLKRVDDVPEALETLYSSMFLSLNADSRQLTARFFQWITLAVKPLRLYEWHHILAFIRQPTPSSLQTWRESEYFTENDDELEKQIRSISMGLVEVKTTTDEPEEYGNRPLSTCARAGSLDPERGETRVVRVIHESVREFLQHTGLANLGPRLAPNPIGDGHLSIISTCLDYLQITELDSLVDARILCPSPPSTPQSGDSARSKRLTTNKPGGGDFGVDDYLDIINESSNLGQTCKVSRWLEMNSFSEGQIYLNEGTHISATSFSATERSRVLEEYFALLMYATFNLFIHARQAQDWGADSSPIIKRFMEGKTWARWIVLREDLPRGAQLLDYAARQGLSSWVRYITKSSRADGDDCTGMHWDSSSFKTPMEEAIFLQLEERADRILKIASFASAGNLGSSSSSDDD